MRVSTWVLGRTFRRLRVRQGAVGRFRSLLAVLGVLMGALSWASGADVRAWNGWVVVNEVLVLRPRSNPQAAATIAQRLTPLAARATFSAVAINGGADVRSGDTVIASVTQAEAQAQNSSPMSLAQVWAQRLQDAYGLPALRSNTTEFLMASGGAREVALIGRMAREAQLASTPPGLTVERSVGIVRISAPQPGRYTLRATRGSESLTWRVTVAEPAATMPAVAISAEVMGQPALRETVAASAAAAAQAGVILRDGAMLRVREVRAARLEPGQATTAQVMATAHGPGLFPVTLTIPVSVRNIAAREVSSERLFYSNYPENLNQAQPLFYGVLEAGKPVKMLGHHRNRSVMPLTSMIRLVNRSSRTLRVALIPGDGGVDRNPTLAGYRAGEQFLADWFTGSAVVLRLPAQSALPIQVHDMELGGTSSSLMLFSLIDEAEAGDVIVLHDCVLPSEVPAEWRLAARSDRPWSLVRPLSIAGTVMVVPSTPSPVYESPIRKMEFNYEVGGRMAFLRIGEQGILGADGRPLLGNFGVTYEITGRVSNPTPNPAVAELYFEASAGYTGGLFFINGELVKVPLLQPKEERLIRRIDLAPGASWPMRLSTVPLSGGSYPVTLTLRPPNSR